MKEQQHGTLSTQVWLLVPANFLTILGYCMICLHIYVPLINNLQKLFKIPSIRSSACITTSTYRFTDSIKIGSCVRDIRHRFHDPGDEIHVRCYECFVQNGLHCIKFVNDVFKHPVVCASYKIFENKDEEIM